MLIYYYLYDTRGNEQRDEGIIWSGYATMEEYLHMKNGGARVYAPSIDIVDDNRGSAA